MSNERLIGILECCLALLSTTTSVPFEHKLLLLDHFRSSSTYEASRNGPSPLTADGSLNQWTVISRLPKITAPTLVYNGEYDTSHDIAQVPFFELIPQVRWITFSNGGHMCHLEGGELRKRIMKVVGEFLSQNTVANIV